MSKFYIQTITIATDATLSSAAKLFQGEPVQYMLFVPEYDDWCITATCNVRLEGALSESGTYAGVGFTNPPTTATSGFKNWEVANDGDAKWNFCEAAMTPFVKVSVTNTATAAAEFILLGKLIF